MVRAMASREIENKAITPAEAPAAAVAVVVADVAPAMVPKPVKRVKVTLAAHYGEYLPGAEITVTEDEQDHLFNAGILVRS